MYLWHWPLFAFLKYFDLNFLEPLEYCPSLLFFILSYFSWKYIEQPFRTTLKFNFKNITYVMLPVVLISAGIYGIIDNGFLSVILTWQSSIQELIIQIF
jgi:peptidoglycan/LPS O-acetylase OafA/YrhL